LRSNRNSGAEGRSDGKEKTLRDDRLVLLVDVTLSPDIIPQSSAVADSRQPFREIEFLAKHMGTISGYALKIEFGMRQS